METYKNRQNIELTLRVIEVFFIVVGVVLVIIQIDYYKNTNYGLTSIEISRDLYSDKTYAANPKIIEAIHTESPILNYNKGAVSDEELNNFLGLIELINSASRVGILNDKIIYEMFSADIVSAYNNKEIRVFINKARNDFKDNDYFSGFESLAERMINFNN